ncbi:TIGR02302 family protein [Siccirubricoccus phaeus]|uniref:TIGR02302 family protein n=1 Tax=Siccirubricoccus phaeus TaxID=2595053 RepID=UPI0011F2B5B2|nr:TIGR02302 family protein [Siccirubricoccus phaeus]
MSQAPLPGEIQGALRRRRRLAGLALWWEEAWPRAWPVLGLLGGFAILAFLDVPARLPPSAHLLLLAGFGGGLGWLAWRGIRGFAWPDAAGAERRLERDSGLRHRPLSALSDRPAGDDPAALALWQVHQQRAAAALGRLKLRAPRPGLPARDPRALRAAVVLGLVAALTIAGADAPRLLLRAFQPSWAGPAPVPALKLEAWVTPPAYTGAAPIFLDPRGGAATVPAGSKLQVSLSGGSGGAAPELVTGPELRPFRALDGGSFTAEAPLTAGQQVAIRRNGSELVQWSLSVQADAPPTVAFAEPPGRAQRGLATRLPWRAEDDWGLAGLRAELRLAARPDAPPLVLDLPLPGGLPKSARGAGQPDLSAHPWAGLEVEAKLIARDGAGQEGQSELAGLTLPERSFTHPVAKQLIALRRQLSLEPNRRTPARQELEAIAQAPEAFEHDAATYLALRSARSRLAYDRRPEAIGEVQEILWETALALEEGRDGRTLRALQQAREALREALDQAEQMPRDDPAQAEQRAEIERRIQELRDAIRQHLEALAERLQRENAESIPFDPQSRLMDQREMDRRTRRMEEAAREGRTEDARRELAELEEMLKALEEGRASRSESAERQQRRERGQQQMGVVQDMVRRQSDMLDRSHQRADGEERERAQRQRQQQRPLPGLRWPPEPPQAQQPPQPSPDAQAETEQDGRRQRALRRALGELMQQFGDLTGEVPDGLGRADQAMREAQEELRGGGDPRDAQQRALRALQEGGRQMAQSMQRQFGQGAQEGDEEGDPQDMAGDQPGGGNGQDQAQGQGEGRDPLGRRTRDVNGTADNGADTRVPEEAELLRTRRLQEELRRRGAERERPAEELDYIDRLLKRF